MAVLLLLAALLGHTFVWVALINRFHSIAMPRSLGHLVTMICMGSLVAVPVGFVWWYLSTGAVSLPLLRLPLPLLLYLGVCWAAAALTSVWWVWREVLHRPTPMLRSHRTRTVELTGTGHSPVSEEHTRDFLVRLPGNEIYGWTSPTGQSQYRDSIRRWTASRSSTSPIFTSPGELPRRTSRTPSDIATS